MDDVTIRPLEREDAAAIAEVQCRSWNESYRGLIPDAIIDEFTGPEGFPKRWRERLQPGVELPTNTWVAETRELGLVGFVSIGPSRDPRFELPGEVWALYLVRAAQKRGIGRALWDAALAGCRDAGWWPGHVWVLADNPSRKFYEHVGGVEIARRPCRLEGAQHLEEVSLRFGG